MLLSCLFLHVFHYIVGKYLISDIASVYNCDQNKKEDKKKDKMKNKKDTKKKKKKNKQDTKKEEDKKNKNK